MLISSKHNEINIKLYYVEFFINIIQLNLIYKHSTNKKIFLSEKNQTSGMVDREKIDRLLDES